MNMLSAEAATVETADSTTVGSVVETLIIETQDSLLDAVAVTVCGSYWKRAFDIVFAMSALFFTLPILMFIAAMIKLESRGPVFFFQDRYGQCGRIFRVFKFRTMYAHETDHTCRRQTEPGDRRVTVIGRFLRAHSIDEAPQLLNVLAGDMSLVGPRPHAVAMLVENVELDSLVDWTQRYSAKPGLTGLAQVSGSRGPLTTIDSAYTRLDHDLQYIRDWSFWSDIKIMLRTVKVCVKDNRTR